MFKINCIVIFIGLVSSVFFSTGFAVAHTANISSSRIAPEPDAHYRVEVGFLGSDIERMLIENKQALSGVDLTEPATFQAYLSSYLSLMHMFGSPARVEAQGRRASQ